ncbi:hypothetical protein [Nostoc sp. WHI]
MTVDLNTQGFSFHPREGKWLSKQEYSVVDIVSSPEGFHPREGK